MANGQGMRGLRTKMALVEAVFALLEKRDFSKITVHDICIGASVSRATFYIHFVDKYELIRFCLGVIGEQMAKELRGRSHRTIVEGILDTLYAYKKVLRNLFVGGGDKEVESMLHQTLTRDYLAFLESLEEKPAVDVPLPMIAGFIGAGGTYILLSWLQDAFPYTREEMVFYLMELTRPAQPPAQE